MRYKFIVIEGIDGSGKTSISKHLAKKYKGRYLYSPPKLIRIFKKFIDRYAPPSIRYRYYLLGNRIYSLIIPFYTRKYHIFCDWYYFSTIAYHSILLNKDLPIPKILEPDKIIYLSAKWDFIKERLEKKKSKDRYEGLDFLKKVDLKYKNILRNKSNVIYIDTSNKSIGKSLENIQI